MVGLLTAIRLNAEQERKARAQAHAQALADNPTATRAEVERVGNQFVANVHFPDGGSRTYTVHLPKEATTVTARDLERMEDEYNDATAEFVGKMFAIINDLQRRIKEQDAEIAEWTHRYRVGGAPVVADDELDGVRWR